MKLKYLFWLLGIVALAAISFPLVMIGPRNLWGMLWFDQRKEGTLQVGMKAPDVELIALDGVTRVRLLKQLAGRPLVLVFGSYT